MFWMNLHVSCFKYKNLREPSFSVVLFIHIKKRTQVLKTQMCAAGAHFSKRKFLIWNLFFAPKAHLHSILTFLINLQREIQLKGAPPRWLRQIVSDEVAIDEKLYIVCLFLIILFHVLMVSQNVSKINGISTIPCKHIFSKHYQLAMGIKYGLRGPKTPSNFLRKS